VTAPAGRSGTGTSADLFFEDLTPGRRFDLGVLTVDGDEMVAFARRFDPQWYHVDEDLARQSHHGGLIASGFYTVSLFMRAYVDHVLSRAAADASPGLEELRWLAPVRAGDRLAVRLDVMGSKPSTARPGLGTVTLTGTMLRLDAEGRPECEVLRTRFRGWFTLRTPGPDPTGPDPAPLTPDPDPPATEPTVAGPPSPDPLVAGPPGTADPVVAGLLAQPAPPPPPVPARVPVDAPTAVLPAPVAAGSVPPPRVPHHTDAPTAVIPAARDDGPPPTAAD
jgi:acyl dehydratase